MPSLVCSHLGFSWPSGGVVLDDLSVAFPDGLTGLVGRNGSGKSTLIKILAGELTATAGSVGGADRPRLPAPAVDLGRRPQRRLGAGHRRRARRAAPGRGRDRHRGRLRAAGRSVGRRGPGRGGAGRGRLRRVWPSNGPSARCPAARSILLALAALFLARPEVLLLDEPTNNLDRSARERLAAALGRWRGPVIMVSHDRELLERATTIAELRDSRITLYGGNFADYEAAVAAEQEVAQRNLRSAEAELRRERREQIEQLVKLDRRRRTGKARSHGESARPRSTTTAAKPRSRRRSCRPGRPTTWPGPGSGWARPRSGSATTI